MIFRICICLLFSNFDVSCVLPEIKVGMLISWTSTDVAAQRFAGAITRVLDDINNSSEILNGTKMTYIQADPDCTDRDGLGATVTLFNKNVDVFIGPPCSQSCLSGGLLSSYEKIPMISFGCSSNQLSNKTNYPFFARTKPFARTSSMYTPKTFLQLLNFFKWKHLCLIESSNDIYTPISQQVYKILSANGNLSIVYEKYYPDYIEYESKKNILVALQSKCRIFIFITSRLDVIDFSVHARKLGWMNNNEYAFLHLDFDFDFLGWNEARLKQWGLSKEYILSNVLEGIITVSNSRPNDSDAKYNDFRQDVVNRLQTNFGIETSVSNILSNAGYLYDATMLYARAVDAMLKANSSASIKDARQVFQFMKKTTFEGITGHVEIDEFGDRIPLFVIGNVHNGTILQSAVYDPLSDVSLSILDKTIFFLGGYTSAPVDVPKCGFENEKCLVAFQYVPLVAGLLSVLVLFIITSIYFYRKKKYEMKILMNGLVINWKDLSFADEGFLKASVRSRMSLKSRTSDLSNHQTNGKFFAPLSRVVFYKSTQLYMKTIRQCKLEINKELLIDLKHIKDLNGTNINSFFGIAVRGQDYHIFWSYCSKGTLQDVLQNDEITCDWMFRLSFAKDIAQGLHEIQRSAVGVHGNLRSSNCLVDNRWVCKISNFGLKKFQSSIKVEKSSYEECRRNLCKAPERIRNPEAPCTASSDIFSYGIILYEICTRGDPFELDIQCGLQAKDIIEMIKSNSIPVYPPTIPENDAPSNYINLMTNCWNVIPSNRPSTRDIIKSILKMQKQSGIKGSLVDHMLMRMEKYTDNLENLVAERTDQLEQEKIKTENLLYKMLPKTVANKLKEGHPVVAESFSSVTIFFSDIVGFTSICSESSPLEVVEMLNDLYVCFDNCIDKYDVYKVETIGDAYMVVSGIPICNGNKHVEEIATMSLDLLSCVKSFKIRHRPDTQMQLRIGMHTGPCVAGVVGLKMPRYCLFGDTVNYASRMESSGLALRIHVSPKSHELLEQLGTYHFLKRGPVEMKGKGIIETFFLTGKDGFNKELPDLNLAASLESHSFK